MRSEDSFFEEFIKENIAIQNKKMNGVMRWFLAVGPALALGKYLGAFHSATYTGYLVVTLFLLAILIVHTWLLKKIPDNIYLGYLALAAIEVMVVVMNIVHVGIYLTFFLVPVISLVYCRRRAYVGASVMGFVGMAAATAATSSFYAAKYIDKTAMEYFVGHFSGYAMEYLAMFVAGLAVNHIMSRSFEKTCEDLLVIRKKEEESVTDELTGLLNRHGFSNRLETLKNKELSPDFTVVAMDVNGLKWTNDRYGHDAGDELLRAAAGCIRTCFGADGTCFRMGGDEFEVFTEVSEDRLKVILNKLEESCAATRLSASGEAFSISYGYVRKADDPERSLDAMLSTADEKMYESKRKYYEKHDRRNS